MIARPDGAALRAFLSRIGRRIAWLAAAEGAAVGLGLAALIALWRWRASGSLTPALVAATVLAAIGCALALGITLRRRRGIPTLVERRAPQCRNVVVTAAELLDRPTTVRPEIGALVLRQATRTVDALDASVLFPARRALLALAAGAALLAVSLVAVSVQPALSSAPVNIPLDALGIDRVVATVTPPAYANQRPQALRDPTRIEALAGSRIELAIEATAAAVNMETIEGNQRLDPVATGTFSATTRADADGYLSIEPLASNGRTGLRRLIGLTVTPDRAPRVRVTAPGRDLFLTDARRTLDVAIEADDDIALASLKLRYTKVSGSGERFTFTDGEVPVTITRTDSRTWKARGNLALSALGLEQGDVVVYRGVAADERPGAAATESDAFIVEITSPGAIASEGFAIDDELDRNAVSQQMVILKTERLLERRASMNAEAFAEESRNIAAEQRTVRAEFVFMMGGELAQEVTGGEAGITELNEEEEAEAGDDILAGRLANRGRVELLRAIRSMSDASTRLVAVEVDSALSDERLALEHLQRAFSRTRYILRALTQRERLDLSRRLTGALVDAGRDVRPVAEAGVDARVVTLRGALAEIAALASDANAPAAGAGARLSVVAERVLRVDPSSAALQGISRQLADAAGAVTGGRVDDGRALVDSAAVRLGAVIRAALVKAPSRSLPADVQRLEGALVDALRRPGGAR